jgi:hypothetical protein
VPETTRHHAGSQTVTAATLKADNAGARAQIKVVHTFIAPLTASHAQSFTHTQQRYVASIDDDPGRLRRCELYSGTWPVHTHAFLRVAQAR